MGGREVSRPYRVWFFAEGERFLSFWRYHRPRWRGRRWCCGVADSSFGLKSDMPQYQRQVRSTGIAKRLFFMFLFQSPSIFPLSPSPSPQHNTTTPRKDLRKQIHKHKQPPAIYTENQQVAFFSQSSQHCGPQPCELSFFSLPL